MTSRHRRLAALEGQLHYTLDCDALERLARDVAAEEGVDPAEILADVLALAERTRGMTTEAMAAMLAAEEGITVAQLEAEAIAIARRRDAPFGGMPV